MGGADADAGERVPCERNDRRDDAELRGGVDGRGDAGACEGAGAVPIKGRRQRLGGGVRDVPGVAAVLAGEPVRYERRRLGGAAWFSIE